MRLGDHFWSGLEKLIYFVLFPALLFHAIARTRIDFAAAAPFVASGVAAMCGGMLLGLLLRAPVRRPADERSGSPRHGLRLAVPVRLPLQFLHRPGGGGKLHGEAGIAAMGILIGAMVPLANLASVWMLARHGQLGVLREIARNPLILATLAGLLFNLGGAALPEVAGQFLGRLSEASIALGLLAVGAALSAAPGVRGAPGLRWPARGQAAGRAGHRLAGGADAGTDGVYFDVVVMFGALPTASSAYILAMRMGGDGPGVAWLISASTLGAMLTMPLWLVALGAA
jgi:malonate transporter